MLCEQDSWTVRQIRGKNNINTVQFLAQTDRFVSLDLNVLSQAAGFSMVLSVYVFFLSKPWVPLTAIDLSINPAPLSYCCSLGQTKNH